MSDAEVTGKDGEGATTSDGGAAAPEPAEAAPARPSGDDGVEESPLSQRLSKAPEEAPISLPSDGERYSAAKAKVGAHLKVYRLTKLLGLGPTTATYEGVKGPGDAGERVVVRMLFGDVAKSERAKSHFLRSAYAASRFSHPRTIPVVADGTDDDGAVYTVRPYVDAEPVSRFVRSSDPDEQRILRLTEQLLDILEIAHAHGIVHGAISPENVLVTPRGSTRLVDFSVPPGLGSRKDDESPLAELRIGPYTPPERCGPSHLSSATEQGDVWSAGAIMYYALTGTAPRGDASSPARLASEKPKPIRDVRPETSEHVANVIDHALETDPAVRYDSAYAMLGDVRRVLAGRKPKLAQSSGPVPSGVLADSSGGPPSTFRPPPFRGPTSTTGAAARKPSGSQWRGNLSLIVLIAAILAAATYVMVREKTEEQERGGPATAPS